MASEIDFSDLYCALDSAATTMALSSQDWSVAADFAWLYGIFCGWDDWSLEDGDATDTIAARFRWNAEKVARLRRLRAAVEAFDINVVSDLAGRLLPPGGEVSAQYAVHATGKDGRRMPRLVVHHSLEAAQRWKARLEADRTIVKVTLAIHERQARTWGDGSEHYTPWSPVVSDSSEAPDG